MSNICRFQLLKYKDLMFQFVIYLDYIHYIMINKEVRNQTQTQWQAQ